MDPRVRVAPSLDEKLDLLGRAAADDISCPGKEEKRTERQRDRERFIYHAALPNGGSIPVLKVLQQGGCERNCHYCAQRQGGIDRDPLSFTPDELSRLFHDLYSRGKVRGLFLSSAIHRGAVRTMDRMLATAELLRGRYAFRGYIHVKIVPGSTPDQVQRAMALASRVSVNMEAPTVAHLAEIAPSKRFEQHILAPMRQVARAQDQGRFHPGGQTTQLVVGVSDETDRQITGAAQHLYRRMRLARVYYSAFRPVAGTPLQDRPAAAAVREHRLYQADFMLRFYGFDAEEIPFTDSGHLFLDADPKTLWARMNPERFPVEINNASLRELLRVPGIGPQSAKRLLAMRRKARITNLDALGAAGARSHRAAPHILLDGRAPRLPEQLRLFE